MKTPWKGPHGDVAAANLQASGTEDRDEAVGSGEDLGHVLPAPAFTGRCFCEECQPDYWNRADMDNGRREPDSRAASTSEPEPPQCPAAVHQLTPSATLGELTDDQIRHIYPNFGVREHITNDRGGCWCGPKVEFVEGGAIIIHEVEQ